MSSCAARQAARRILWIACVVVGPLLSACTGIPASVRRAMDASGDSAYAMGDRGFRLFGFVVIPTRGILAGAVASNSSGVKNHIDCGSSTEGISARVLWVPSSSIRSEDAATACQWVLQGVQYTMQFVDNTPLPDIQYRLYLVPTGESAEVHSISWTPLGRLHPTYLAHWSDDTTATRAFIIGTYAHESMHILTTILDIQLPNDVNEEHIGYLTQACAILMQTRALHAQDILTGQPRKDAWNVPDSLERSLSSHIAFDTALADAFDAQGLLVSDSKSGRRLANQCERALEAYFSLPSRAN